MGYDMSIVGGNTPEEDAEHVAANEAFMAACAERDALPGPEPMPEWTDEMTALVTDLTNKGEDWNIARLIVQGYSDEFIAAQRKVETAMSAYYRSDKSYFRLNIWGMGAYRTAMEEVGMGTFQYDMDDWPDLPDGLNKEKFWEWQEDEDAATIEEGIAFQAFADQLDEHRKAHFDADDKIPLHKFCSNDGWLVTEEECRMGLNAFTAFVGPNPTGNLVDDPESWPEISSYTRLNRPDRTALVLDRATVLNVKLSADALDTLTEDYFCEWLAYLERGSQRGGFEVY